MANVTKLTELAAKWADAPRVDVEPCRYSVVVKLDKADEKVGSGLLYKPDTVKDREQLAATTGTLHAVGGNAFEDWEGTKPKPGDRILLKKYPGQFLGSQADENDPWRIAQDTDILGVLR